jgi:hypothetical protein
VKDSSVPGLWCLKWRLLCPDLWCVRSDRLFLALTFFDRNKFCTALLYCTEVLLLGSFWMIQTDWKLMPWKIMKFFFIFIFKMRKTCGSFYYLLFELPYVVSVAMFIYELAHNPCYNSTLNEMNKIFIFFNSNPNSNVTTYDLRMFPYYITSWMPHTICHISLFAQTHGSRKFLIISRIYN